ncbi:hypothetical protein OGATHE_001091 [Ogataea polymorpha]|uniref:Uncharacterized protein n=1 Tax=Ogataea polymorpha TaxID=460523 RepID=A0A9P8PS45_9ASCO|nr:hypothetical protein OGATHE_001091 [Ogataea polymorpha]
MNRKRTTPSGFRVASAAIDAGTAPLGFLLISRPSWTTELHFMVAGLTVAVVVLHLGFGGGAVTARLLANALHRNLVNSSSSVPKYLGNSIVYRFPERVEHLNRKLLDLTRWSSNFALSGSDRCAMGSVWCSDIFCYGHASEDANM